MDIFVTKMAAVVFISIIALFLFGLVFLIGEFPLVSPGNKFMKYIQKVLNVCIGIFLVYGVINILFIFDMSKYC